MRGLNVVLEKWLPPILLGSVALAGCAQSPPAWEAANPLRPLPIEPVGPDVTLASLPDPPTPTRVRLGRWLFYDTRLSSDGTVSCATCHRPEYAFSEPTAVSTGIRGQRGRRKAPSFVNAAVTLYPHFFWDGRAASLEAQALGPIENPIEMGSTHAGLEARLRAIPSYGGYFAEAFGSEGITRDRIAKALADYERTRMSGNSPYDRWRRQRDGAAVSDAVKGGHDLFYGKGACNQCHVGSRFTDNTFHNIGIGWDASSRTFSDEGRASVSRGGDAASPGDGDRGAFKTPTLRDVAKHPPYMHDGSVPTLRAVVQYYNRGGNANPFMDPKMPKSPLRLSEAEIDALVAMLEALNGEGYEDVPPTAFPQ
jgi:cytochrome c peroxidase